MLTPANGLTGAVNQIVERGRALARLEVELAAIELRQKVAAIGGGAAMFGGSAVLGLFGLGFLLAGISAALAIFLPSWASLLVVAAALLVGATCLALVGRSLLARGVPPLPEQAITEARRTGEALKGNGYG